MAALFQCKVPHTGIQQWRHKLLAAAQLLRLLLNASHKHQPCLADSASDVVRLCSCLHALGMRRAME